MTEITIDLPMPPSANRLWRRGRKGMIKSVEYVKWLRHADGEAIAGHARWKGYKINGKFSVTILLNDNYRGDGDNRIKALLDWAQSRELVVNDVYCRSGSWSWVNAQSAPLGARMILRSIEVEP
jgi:Holliday junction resolvase RusA-like endonuclease